MMKASNNWRMEMASICFSPAQFAKLIQEKGFNALEQIENAETYFAHTPLQNTIEKESLISHMEKVKDVFLELVNLHGLDRIVDKHINLLVSHNAIVKKQ